MELARASMDAYLWAVLKYITKNYNRETAERDVEPLRDYIPKSSDNFIMRLWEAKPYMIGRILHKHRGKPDAIPAVIAYLS